MVAGMNGATQMAGVPKWKVYRDGEYVGCVKHADDAAVLVSVAGGVVKYDHRLIVWTEGAEAFEAGESYDRAGDVMRERVEQYRLAGAKRFADKVNRFMAAGR